MLRHFLWRGKVNEQGGEGDEGDPQEAPQKDIPQDGSGLEASGDPLKGAPKRRKGRKAQASKEVDFTLNWGTDIEAKLLPTVVASLDAGGVEGARSRLASQTRVLPLQGSL